MGDQLRPEVLSAFAYHLDGMEKEAFRLPPGASTAAKHIGEFATGFLGNVRKAVNRPFSMREAWKEMGRGVGQKVGPKGGVLEKGTGQVGKLEDFTAPAKGALSPTGKYVVPSDEALRVRAGLTPEKIEKGTLFQRVTGRGGPMSEAEVAKRTRKAISPEELAREGLAPTAKGFAEYGKRMALRDRKHIGRVLDVVRMPKWVGRTGAHQYQNVDKALPLTGLLSGSTKVPGTNRIKAIAQELSRSGWTGKGELTKYMPVGSKGMMAGFAASSIPGIVNAPKATPTGEGGRLERLMGEVGSAGGMIAGTGVGFVPGMAMWGLGQYGGKHVGRILDRYRAGATLPQAVMAPSPQEAAEQLQTIQRYYG